MNAREKEDLNTVLDKMINRFQRNDTNGAIAMICLAQIKLRDAKITEEDDEKYRDQLKSDLKDFLMD